MTSLAQHGNGLRAYQAGAADDDDFHGFTSVVDHRGRHVSSNAPPRKRSEFIKTYRSKITRFCHGPSACA